MAMVGFDAGKHKKVAYASLFLWVERKVEEKQCEND